MLGWFVETSKMIPVMIWVVACITAVAFVIGYFRNKAISKNKASSQKSSGDEDLSLSIFR